MKINKVWLVPVFVALVFLLVVVWALTASRKKKAPVAPPGAVSDVKAKPVDGIPRNSTVSEYTAIVNEVGLIVNFKTPSSSGVPGDTSIKSYIISLRNSTIADTNEYLTSTTFIAGGTGTLAAYKWKDGAGGTAEGSIPAELFISSSLFNGLVDGQSYIIGIKAVNSKNILAVSESSSAAILYNTCKLGLQGACGWSNADTSGRGQPTVISASSGSAATSGSFAGAAAVVGAPCDPSSTTKAPNMLYKIDSQSVCAAAGCETGYIFENGGCTRRIVAGDQCGTGYNYYYTYNSASGAKLTDANGDILTCDTKATCPTSLLLSNTKFKLLSYACEIECISDSYKGNPVPASGCVAKSCTNTADKPLVTGVTSWGGTTWGTNGDGCVPTCGTDYKINPTNSKSCIAKICSDIDLPDGTSSWRNNSDTAGTRGENCSADACASTYQYETFNNVMICRKKECAIDKQTDLLETTASWYGDWGECQPVCKTGFTVTTTATGKTICA